VGVGDVEPAGARDVTLEALEAYAAALWSAVPPGAVIWLSGDLGAGKTTFVQAVARAAGAEGARSPTFALVHEYETPEGLLIHADCYRLRDPDEALDLDFPGLMGTARLLLIEWPEQAGRHAPPPTVHLTFQHGAEAGVRRLERVV
jgi:tRNA threonylcarbamoyladenosine biosynthesis protein TsaE